MECTMRETIEMWELVNKSKSNQERITELEREIATLRSVLRETLPWLTGESASLYARTEELLAKE